MFWSLVMALSASIGEEIDVWPLSPCMTLCLDLEEDRWVRVRERRCPLGTETAFNVTDFRGGCGLLDA